MTILGERADQSVLVQPDAAVELAAQGSFDANHDALTYQWSGTAPDGVTSLSIQGTGSAATFTPALEGLYTIDLTVSDGIASNTLTRKVTVVRPPPRFTGCANGTVLDTLTNLLWLQDAGCFALNLDVAANQWGFSAPTAQERVSTLLSAGVCGLSDGSALGDWRLPTVNEFRQIVTVTPFPAGPPALLNGSGTGQWTEGDVFINVGATDTPAKRYIYWTADSDPDPLVLNNWFFVNFDYVIPAEWSGSQFSATPNSLWPVRALRAGEQCPAVP